MTNRRFYIGQCGVLNGIEWRIVPGRKADTDLVLDIRASEYRHVPMALGFLMADFLCENEEFALYRRDKGYSGGDRYMHFVNGARFGWEVAVEQLELERAARRAA